MVHAAEHDPKVQRGSGRFMLAVGPRFRAQNRALKGVESAGSKQRRPVG
jgi:hypothetical protein